MERYIPFLTACSFWLYAVNATVLVLHEIESAYWQEWRLFRLRGGITGFLIMHVPMIALVFWGLIETFRGSTAGAILSLILAAAGLIAFFIHRYYTAKGRKEFTLPISRFILGAALVLSVVQIAAAVILIAVWFPAMAAFTGKILSVAGLSAVTLWGAVPLGFALGMNPVLIVMLAAAGSALPTGIVAFGVAALRRKFIGKEKRPKSGLARRIWMRFGIIGLGLIAPWTTGAVIAAAIAVSLKSDPKRTLLWMAVGIVLCAVILTVLGALGIAAFHRRG